jgi:hypothetical protein
MSLIRFRFRDFEIDYAEIIIVRSEADICGVPSEIRRTKNLCEQPPITRINKLLEALAGSRRIVVNAFDSGDGPYGVRRGPFLGGS